MVKRKSNHNKDDAFEILLGFSFVNFFLFEKNVLKFEFDEFFTKSHANEKFFFSLNIFNWSPLKLRPKGMKSSHAFDLKI